MSNKIIHKEIEEFYIDKNEKYGETPKGVGWHDEKRAKSRYEIVSKMLPNYCTVMEYGPGNGIYIDDIQVSGTQRRYIGVEPMEPYFNILKKKESAGRLFLNESIESYTTVDKKIDHDWAFTIGVFALKLGISEKEYKSWAYTCMANMMYEAKEGIIINAFQDRVDYKNVEQFYFNLNDLIKFFHELGHSHYELINQPTNTQFEFYLKIFKK